MIGIISFFSGLTCCIILAFLISFLAANDRLIIPLFVYLSVSAILHLFGIAIALLFSIGFKFVNRIYCYLTFVLVIAIAILILQIYYFDYPGMGMAYIGFLAIFSICYLTGKSCEFLTKYKHNRHRIMKD